MRCVGVFVRHVGHGDLLGLQEQLLALGPVGDDVHALVDRIELGQIEARQVLAADLRAVQPRERALPVGAGG